MVDQESGQQPTPQTLRYASSRNLVGLQYYADWEIDKALAAFKEAATADPENPEYHLNMARGYARGSNYPLAIQSLGDYLRTEPDDFVAERYQRLFSSVLDEVETIVIEQTRMMGMPIQQTGKAIQMWLEFRIALGRQPLEIIEPAQWAAALILAICKINFLDHTRADISALCGVAQERVRETYDQLVETLDLMPADYRYFTGEDNPLDKLVQAAEMLEKLYAGFQDD